VCLVSFLTLSLRGLDGVAGEAVNVSSGLGYNGVDENGKARWNLVDNADILQIEVLVTVVKLVTDSRQYDQWKVYIP